MKRFLIILFVIILIVSMSLAGVSCKKTDEASAAKISLVETTTPQAPSFETTASTPEITSKAISGESELGVATIKDPDPEKIIESKAFGVVPANQLGLILAEGLTRKDAQKMADGLGASIVGEIEFINFYQLETKDNTEDELAATLDKASKIVGVELAFPNGAVLPQATVEGSSCSPLNDPLYTEGSNARPYEMIGLQNAWDIVKASGVKINKVRVGIVDSAIYTESDNGFSQELYFPDENGKYPEGKAQIETLDEDNDITFAPEANPKTGDLIHGGLSHCTMMAHIIGADPNGGGPVGVTSIAGENLSIVVTNNFNTPTTIPANNIDPNDITQYQGNIYTLLVDLKKQVENNVKVINLSLGSGRPSEANAAECQAYKLFFEKMNKDHPDVVFVAAAGNENGFLDGTNYGPGGISLPNVITVGALNQDGNQAQAADWYKEEDLKVLYQESIKIGAIPEDMSFDTYKEFYPAGSNYAMGNGEVTLSACGTNVPVGLDQDGKPVTVNGTSFATPQVTGAIALLQSINPKLSAAEIKKILVESAASEVDRDGTKVVVSAEMGGGVLRVDRAVLRVINDMRKAQDKNAEDLKIEDMKALTSIKLTASGGPTDYTITATVSEVGSGGTDISIETTGEGELKGSTTQSIGAPGQVSWTLTKESDDYFIKVFRSDTGDCAFLTLGKDELGEENLIHGVVPMQVTATMSGETGNGTFYVSYEFWNVGELGGAQYSAVTCTSYFSENDSRSVTGGTFTGGPNGDIYVQGNTMVIHLKVHDGITITNEGGDSFSIDNPGAFDGWID